MTIVTIIVSGGYIEEVKATGPVKVKVFDRDQKACGEKYWYSITPTITKRRKS